MFQEDVECSKFLWIIAISLEEQIWWEDCQITQADKQK